MKCICDFETESFRTLRSHFATNHPNDDFLTSFFNLIEENWVSLGRGLRRRYLLQKASYKCTRCGFDERRPCGSTILEIDHIDGNHQNSVIENLQVLCPNCHALTPKYRNWHNKGNKKNTEILRPGNKDYDKRKEISKERAEARAKILLEKKLNREPKKKKEDEAMSKLREMKAQFEDDFKKEVIQLHESGEIDFSKYGWVQLLADKVDEQPQVVGRRVRKLLPGFFVEHCFSREYTKCRRNKNGVDPAR
jgi:hypothetical protein